MSIYIAGIESLSASDALNLTLYDWVTRKRVFLVCDESILIKNHRAQRTLAIWRLSERCSYRLLLNGTPISNNEKDLYAQWYFLDPRILGYTSFYKFAANHLEYDDFGRVRRALNVDYLVAKMSPYLYQVRKEECLDLPRKSYSQFYCKMSTQQREIYDMAKERYLAYADNYGFTDVALYRMFGELQRVLSGVTAENAPIYPEPRANPRISVLLDLIEQLPSDSQTIIWCRYTHEIESIVTLLRQDYGAESVAQFWGGIKERRRAEEVERFRNGARFFVANKQCGGYGLNLQHCQYAIYYSNDFSWSARAQSEDRIHRLGQTQNVHIIDIVCSASIDELIQRALSRKQTLVDVFRETIADQKDKNQIAHILDGRKEG